jgi:hypothetical protein
MITVRVELMDIYGTTKAYPRNPQAELIARIAGTKTLTKSVLSNTLALGCTVEIVDRFGNISKTYDPTRIESLPQIA